MATWGPTVIAANGDDGWEANRTDASVAIAGMDADGLPLGGKNSDYHDAGFRFQNVTVPKGSTIGSAHLELYRNWDNSIGTLSGTVYAEDVDDAVTFTGGVPGELYNKTKTTANAAFDIDCSVGYGTAISSDLKAVIQEIVDRDGWASGQDIMLIWWFTGTPDGTYCEVKDYSTANGTHNARLTITYTEGAGGAIPVIMSHYRRLRS